MSFTVSALDCDDDPVEIKAEGLPSGASFTQAFDPATRKQVATFRWTPTAEDEGHSYRLKFSADDEDHEGYESFRSDSRVTIIRVWSANGNPQENAVEDVIFERAQWKGSRRSGGQGELALSGYIKFNKMLSKTERRALIAANPVLITNESTQEVIGQVTANSSGKWSARIPLVDAVVPCTVDAAFLNDTASRSVSRAPNCD
ncbi:MAG: hypothetical protein PHT19_00780 [Methylococcus sp.]|nr:hypothetical protein [Methylococcus sp.]